MKDESLNELFNFCLGVFETILLFNNSVGLLLIDFNEDVTSDFSSLEIGCFLFEIKFDFDDFLCNSLSFFKFDLGKGIFNSSTIYLNILSDLVLFVFSPAPDIVIFGIFILFGICPLELFI